MPLEIIRAFGILKKAAAMANHSLGRLDPERLDAISRACDEVIAGKLTLEALFKLSSVTPMPEVTVGPGDILDLPG